MSSLVPVLSLTVLSALAIGCTGEQAYTPISDDQLDELCRQTTLEINETNTAAVEFNEDGIASYEGDLEVTLFTETEMRVDTDEVIYSVPGGKLLTVDVGEGTWDLFTDMVFAVDVRAPGTSAWEELTLTTSTYDIFWFSSLELNGGSNDFAATTYPLCSSREQDAGGLSIPFDVSQDYELRIRPFPFNGAGDLVGTYQYSLNVALY